MTAPGHSASLALTLCDLEAEQAVLGAALLNNDLYDRLAERLRPAHFAEGLHARIYERIGALLAEGRKATPLTLASAMANDLALKDVGGKAYLANLAGAAFAVVSPQEYARLVRELALRRAVLSEAERLATLARDTGAAPAEQILAEAQGRLDRIGEGEDEPGHEGSVTRYADEAMAAADAAAARGRLPGTSYGIGRLDGLTGGMFAGELILCAGRPGMGKAQPLNSLILMADGKWKRMDEIRFGDRLASIDGSPSHVSGVFPQGEKDIYRLTFSDGRSVDACDEHLWRVYYREWSTPRVMTVAKLRTMLQAKRYKGRLWIDVVDGHFGLDCGQPVRPWLLGALLGNGCFTRGALSFSTADAQTLARFQDEIGETSRVCYAGGYDYRVSKTVSGRGVSECVRALKSLGLWGLSSTQKFIPDTYLSATREVRREVLRGLLDTDGWVEKAGSVCIAVSSERLAADIVKLIRSLGGLAEAKRKPSSYTKDEKVRICHDHFRIVVRHSTPHELLSLVRKKKRAIHSGINVPRLTVRSIVYSHRGAAQCISVTHRSHCYVTNGYTVTHNTALATNIAQAAAGQGKGIVFVSLEMSGAPVALRLLSQLSYDGAFRFAYEAARRGKLNPMERQSMAEARDLLDSYALLMETRRGLGVDEIRIAVRRRARILHQRGYPLGLVIVDHCGLVRPDPRYRGNRVAELGAISQALRGLAGDMGAPVLLLSQLNREVERRESRRPSLADLRDSGRLEEDADAVLLLYRPEYYSWRDRPDPDKDPMAYSEWLPSYDKVRGVFEIGLAKQRNGPTGLVHAFCDMAYNVIRDRKDEAERRAA